MQEIEAFLVRQRLKVLSKGTLKMYRHWLELFFNEIKKKPADVSIEDVTTFIEKQKTGYSKNTLSFFYTILRCFFGFLGRKDMVEMLPKIKRPITVPISLTEQQLNALFAQNVQKNPLLHERNRLMLRFFFATGVRVSELTTIKVSDLSLDKRPFIAIVRGKGDKERKIMLGDKWVKEFRGYLKKRPASQYVFPNFWTNDKISSNTVEVIVKRASIQGKVLVGLKQRAVTPHKLRSTFATWFTEESGDIELAADLLGHSSLNTTKIYSKVTSKRLLKARSPYDFFED